MYTRVEFAKSQWQTLRHAAYPRPINRDHFGNPEPDPAYSHRNPFGLWLYFYRMLFLGNPTVVASPVSSQIFMSNLLKDSVCCLLLVCVTSRHYRDVGLSADAFWADGIGLRWKDLSRRSFSVLMALMTSIMMMIIVIITGISIVIRIMIITLIIILKTISIVIIARPLFN